MAAREHAHVIGGVGGVFLQVVEVTALEQNALYARETLFVQECGVVIGDRHQKTQMGCKLRHFAGNIRCAQQPNAFCLEQRRGLPNQAIELFVMHGGTARYVLHLHQVAPRILVCAHNFLRIVGEEYERVAISGTLVAELLRNFVVHICHGNSRIQNNLEAQPSQIALINGTQRALEHRNVCSSQPCGNFAQFIRLNRRKHFRIKLRRLAFAQARDNIFDNSTFHFKRPLFCSTKHFLRRLRAASQALTTLSYAAATATPLT